MHRAFVEPEWIERWLKDNNIPLPSHVLHRFVHVLRIKPDEPVALFDGAGREITGYISKNNYIINAHIKYNKLDTPQIILAQAALAENKISETLRRGCEFGVDKFIIFVAHKSEPFSMPKLIARKKRLEAIITDAARQSQRLFTPDLLFVESIKDFLGPEGIFGDLNATLRLSQMLKEKKSWDQEFLIVVGPEGGLCAEEIKILEDAQLVGVRWGPYTQRTELAALAAVAICNAFCNRA
jgi:16S rRNA (uracil1498-N3)-methyltransferase